jgi:hypothetical protein
LSSWAVLILCEAGIAGQNNFQILFRPFASLIIGHWLDPWLAALRCMGATVVRAKFWRLGLVPHQSSE